MRQAEASRRPGACVNPEPLTPLRGHDIPSEAPELTQKKSVILRRKESLFGLQMFEISTEMAEVGGGERAQLMMQRGAMALLPAHSCSL